MFLFKIYLRIGNRFKNIKIFIELDFNGFEIFFISTTKSKIMNKSNNEINFNNNIYLKI